MRQSPVAFTPLINIIGFISDIIVLNLAPYIARIYHRLVYNNLARDTPHNATIITLPSPYTTVFPPIVPITASNSAIPPFSTLFLAWSCLHRMVRNLHQTLCYSYIYRRARQWFWKKWLILHIQLDCEEGYLSSLSDSLAVNPGSVIFIIRRVWINL